LGFVLGHQVAQRLFIGHRKDHFSHRVIRVLERRISDPIEDARFPGHPLEIIEIGGFHTALGSFADAMHDLDQQGDQGIRDFLRALKHQGSQECHANSLGMLTNMRRGLGGHASSQAFY
jgi:hypothetical protein